jgi:flagellar operon protein
MAETVINGVTVPFLPAGGVEALRDRGPATGPGGGQPFGELLRKELKELTWSRHAQERLQSRNIVLDDTDMASLRRAVDRADEKGARESLVLLRDLAFIVSVQNRTVVTALDAERARDSVFTNIDSAVVA